MQSEDLEEILRIEAASFSQPWTREMFQTELSPGMSLALVARSEGEGGELLGYLCGWVVRDEFHINNVAVEPEYRQQGIGKRLILEALTRAVKRGARTASLEVRASNVAAQVLYRRLGFTVVGRRRRYYSEPVEDALLMRRDHLEGLLDPNLRGKKA
jgi:ribosomal-protein-alanine N-acetyltransferase